MILMLKEIFLLKTNHTIVCHGNVVRVLSHHDGVYEFGAHEKQNILSKEILQWMTKM